MPREPRRLLNTFYENNGSENLEPANNGSLHAIIAIDHSLVGSTYNKIFELIKPSFASLFGRLCDNSNADDRILKRSLLVVIPDAPSLVAIFCR